MRGTVVVFARAPRLGTVKRRLARDIGDRAALRFHVSTLTALLRGLLACRRFDVVLAVTPDRARMRMPAGVRVAGQGVPVAASMGGVAVPAWAAVGQVARGRLGVRVVGQGRGDLGARMARVLGRYRLVVLMGCDIPQAEPSDVVAAFRLLGRTDAVFGPAVDGGYWLIGLGPRRPSVLFGAVRWSSEHALADTLLRFRRHRVGFVRTLSDVDTAADYRAWRAGSHRAAAGP